MIIIADLTTEPIDIVSAYAVLFETVKFLVFHGVLLLITGGLQRL